MHAYTHTHTHIYICTYVLQRCMHAHRLDHIYMDSKRKDSLDDEVLTCLCPHLAFMILTMTACVTAFLSSATSAGTSSFLAASVCECIHDA